MSSRTLGAVLFLACFLVYGNTIPNGYSIDDEIVTRGHHATSRGLVALPEIFSSSFLDFAGQKFEYRPMTLTSFALEHQIFGDNPHVGHFINVLLYAIIAVVLFHFLRVIFGADATSFCFLAAALFVVHPIHTEVVASLKSRDEILALLFGLVSALSFGRYFEHGRFGYAVGGVAILFVALMSKLSAVPFAVLIPLSLAFKSPAKSRRALVLGAVLVAGLEAYRRFVFWIVPTLVRVPTYVENPLGAGADWLVRVGTGFNSLLFYVEKLLVPYPLGFYYGFDTIELASIVSVRPALSAALHLVLAVYVLRHARALTPAAFGLAWYLVAIAPYSNLLVPTTGIVAERAAYLPSIGFAVVAAAVVFRIAGVATRGPLHITDRSRPAVIGVLVVVLLLAGVTWSRNRDWKDSFTLFEADIGHLRNSVMAHQIYSRELRRAFRDAAASEERTRKLDHAIALSRQALEILPSYAAAHEHIGAIYLHDLGNADQALPNLARASDLEPHYTLAHYDALYASIHLGRFDSALEFGERLLREDPNHVMGLFYVSKVYFKAGQVDRAFEVNARLADLAPDRDLAYLNYAYFYYEQSDIPRAIENFEKALAIAPENPAVLKDFVAILTEHGQLEKARRYALLAQEIGGSGSETTE